MGGADGIALRTFFSYWISDEIILLFTTILWDQRPADVNHQHWIAILQKSETNTCEILDPCVWWYLMNFDDICYIFHFGSFRGPLICIICQKEVRVDLGPCNAKLLNPGALSGAVMAEVASISQAAASLSEMKETAWSTSACCGPHDW